MKKKRLIAIGLAISLVFVATAAAVRKVERVRDRYMVFTSADVRIGYWVQRKFAPAYEIAMRKLNDRLTAAVDRG